MPDLDTEVLVLGGGISGCLTACLLADRGAAVTIVEQLPGLMAGTSRWNEGRLHLGYIYTGTASLRTARLMQAGTAVFETVIERVAGSRLPGDAYSSPMVYVVDEASMFPAETLWRRARVVAEVLADSAAQLPGLRRHVGDGGLLERISPAQAMELTGTRGIAAAWQTTERSIASRVVAELIAAAVAERGIPVTQARVDSVRRVSSGWRVVMEQQTQLHSPILVNCLWENRTAIDRGVGFGDEPVSIRYRCALFGRDLTRLQEHAPSSRVLGPFGDVTPYANGDAVLTWYAAGLMAASDTGRPPPVPGQGELDADRSSLMRAHLDALGIHPDLVESLDRWDVRGGYVVAYGHGDIDRRDSPLHRRDRPGAWELEPGYISVDTGKLCLGPLMATRAADLAWRRLRSLSRAVAPSC